MDSAAFLELADKAAVAQAYRETAKQADSVHGSIANFGGWIEAPEGYREMAKTMDQSCREFYGLVRWVTIRAAELMPEVSSKLQHARTTSAPWHNTPDFPWDAAIGELKLVEDMARSVASRQTPAEPDTPLQKSILKALDGKGMTKEKLAAAVCGGDGSRLYKPGGIKELQSQKRIQKKSGVGYYRPDKPPK